MSLFRPRFPMTMRKRNTHRASRPSSRTCDSFRSQRISDTAGFRNRRGWHPSPVYFSFESNSQMLTQQLRLSPEFVARAFENDPTFDENDVAVGERIERREIFVDDERGDATLAHGS